MIKINYSVNGVPHEIDVVGASVTGPEMVMLDEDDDLLQHVKWRNQGYTVEPFLSQESYDRIRENIRDIIMRTLRHFGAEVPSRFRPEDYHKITARYPGLHEKFIAKTRMCFPIEEFAVPKEELVDRVSEICRIPLTLKGKIPEVYCPRLCRPQGGGIRDNNPPHRDAWVDRLRHGLNIYIPIAGNDENSSLALIPGSHLWKESQIERTEEGAVIDGVPYTTPAVIRTDYGIEMIRPTIRYNEFMLFSPYLIHGGASNLNRDTTRVSIEMRLFRK